jgi:hypothetical protein
MSFAVSTSDCAVAVAGAAAPQIKATAAARNSCAVPKLQPWSISRRHWPGGGDEGMLETIAIILIILWLLGMVSGYTLGNFIWVLLVIAVVLFLVRLVSGRRVV